MRGRITLFQGILFGLFGLGALLGLIVFATYTSNNNGGSNAVGDVTIWGTLPKSDMDTALTAAGQADSQLKHLTYMQKDPQTLPQDLATAIATGKSPDLVLASQEELLALAPFLTPIPLATLSANTFTSTFVGEASLLAAPGGAGYYGIPYLVDPLVLYSNNRILTSDNIALPPSTWEALTGLVPKVAVLTPSRQITQGLIALGTYSNVHNARGILSMLFQQVSVPVSARNAGSTVSADLGNSVDNNGVPAGQAVVRFYTQFADPAKVSYTWNPSLQDSQGAFLAGDLALYLGYASEARFLSSANPNLDFSVSPVPQPATATLKDTYGLLYSLMIPRGAQNSAGAFQAAALLTNSDEQGSSAVSTGLAPAVRKELNAPPSDPVAAVSYASALYARGWLSPDPVHTDQIFSSMINTVISGRSTIDTAISTAENSLDALTQ